MTSILTILFFTFHVWSDSFREVPFNHTQMKGIFKTASLPDAVPELKLGFKKRTRCARDYAHTLDKRLLAFLAKVKRVPSWQRF